MTPMSPQFSSNELNQLLRMELAEGGHQSAEDALLAGLKVLRDSRERQLQLEDRLASLQDGRAIELGSDDELGTFFDAIDAEVDAELQNVARPKT
jgi:hypothetical protein